MRDVTEVWREFVEKIMEARELWEEFTEIGRSLPSLDYLPMKTQEVLSRVSIWSTFENAVDAMISYAATQGGWEIFLPEEKPKEEPITEKKEKTNARGK